MTKLKWGIVGCGSVVKNKSGPSILQNGNEIVCVMCRNVKNASDFTDKYNIPVLTDDIDEIINSPEVDIVYVATPPSSHRDYVIRAANAGKHVLVEKPMALNAEQAEEMIKACEKSGVELFVAYYRRFHPQVRKMKELLESRSIGTPIQAFFDVSMGISYGRNNNWRENPEINGGGYFVDIASHRIDVMTYLFGISCDSTGFATTFDRGCRIEQTASVCIKFESGVQCIGMSDFYSGRVADKFTIFGKKGVISADCLDSHKFLLKTDSNDENEFCFNKFQYPHMGLISHIEDVIQNKVENLSSGRTAFATEKILDNVVRCVKRG